MSDNKELLQNALNFDGLSHYTEKIKNFVKDVASDLDANLDAEIQRATARENEIADALTEEAARAKNAEQALSDTIAAGKIIWNDKYTKNEIDNKFSALETNIDWKEAVATYADIAAAYPSPADGWTVNVKDTDYTYRYNGTNWIAISANAVPKATTDIDGLLSKEDYKKLSNIEENATKYIHPNEPGYKHIPSGGSDGQILMYSENGTAVWGDYVEAVEAEDINYSNSKSGLSATNVQDALDELAETNGTHDVDLKGATGVGTGTLFVIGNGDYSDSKSNAFRVNGLGATYAKDAYNSTGADYAEFFEWEDQNPNNEDRVGLFVTFDENNPNMIRIANENDYILGIVSGNPCIIGNSDESWLGRYMFDDFGRFIYNDTEVEVDEIEEETGEITKVKKTISFYKLNPDYDPEQKYIHRSERPEWDYIGMMGVLSVYDDGTCAVGGYCKCGNNGMATISTERGYERYKVLERVNDNIIKVVVK